MDTTIADVVHKIEHWAGEHIRMLEEHLKGHPNRLPDAPVAQLEAPVETKPSEAIVPAPENN